MSLSGSMSRCSQLLVTSYGIGPQCVFNILTLKYLNIHISIHTKSVKIDNTSTTPSCNGSKDMGNSVPGAVFSYTMPKIDFYFSVVLNGGKTHEFDISHTMVTSIITCPNSQVP